MQCTWTKELFPEPAIPITNTQIGLFSGVPRFHSSVHSKSLEHSLKPTRDESGAFPDLFLGFHLPALWCNFFPVLILPGEDSKEDTN